MEIYLELEKFRLVISSAGKTDLNSDINTSVKVPEMIIHTFVKSAIKHRLRHKKDHGEILIITGVNPGVNEKRLLLITVSTIWLDKLST